MLATYDEFDHLDRIDETIVQGTLESAFNQSWSKWIETPNGCTMTINMAQLHWSNLLELPISKLSVMLKVNDHIVKPVIV